MSGKRQTLVLCCAWKDARRYADKYLGTDPPATIVQAGRLCALQHPRLDGYGPDALKTMAEAYNLPLLKVEARAPLQDSQRAIAAPSNNRALKEAQ